MHEMTGQHRSSVARQNIGQQRNDSGGCLTMRERSERVGSPGTYVTE